MEASVWRPEETEDRPAREVRPRVRNPNHPHGLPRREDTDMAQLVGPLLTVPTSGARRHLIEEPRGLALTFATLGNEGREGDRVSPSLRRSIVRLCRGYRWNRRKSSDPSSNMDTGSLDSGGHFSPGMKLWFGSDHAAVMWTGNRLDILDLQILFKSLL